MSPCHLVFELVDPEWHVWETTAPSGRRYTIYPTVLGRLEVWAIAINRRALIQPRFDKQSDAIRFCQEQEDALQPVAA